MLYFMFLLLKSLFKNIHCQVILFCSLLAKINSKYRSKNNIDDKEECDRNIVCAMLSLSCQLWTNKWRYLLDMWTPQSEASSVKRLELKVLTRGWHNIECTTTNSMGNVLEKFPQKQIRIHEQVIY